MQIWPCLLGHPVHCFATANAIRHKCFTIIYQIAQVMPPKGKNPMGNPMGKPGIKKRSSKRLKRLKEKQQQLPKTKKGIPPIQRPKRLTNVTEVSAATSSTAPSCSVISGNT